MDKNVREDTPMVNRTIMEIRGATAQGGNYIRIAKRCHCRWKIKTPKLQRDRALEIEIMRKKRWDQGIYRNDNGICLVLLLCFLIFPFLLPPSSSMGHAGRVRFTCIRYKLRISDPWNKKKVGYGLGLNPKTSSENPTSFYRTDPFATNRFSLWMFSINDPTCEKENTKYGQVTHNSL